MLAFIPSRQSGKTCLTGARYLTLRREAAGLTRSEVAVRLHTLALRNPFDLAPRRVRPNADEALALIDLLETEGARARHRVTINALSTIFPLDPDVYFQLLEEPVERHPTICRLCGCSPNDLCTGASGVCSFDLGAKFCHRCRDASFVRRAA